VLNPNVSKLLLAHPTFHLETKAMVANSAQELEQLANED
jgi:hypothetical protein